MNFQLLRYKILRNWYPFLRFVSKQRRKSKLVLFFFKDDFYDFSNSVNPWVKILSYLILGATLLTLLIPVFLPHLSELNSLASGIEPYLLFGFGIMFYLRFFLEHRSIDFFLTRWLEAVSATIALVLSIEIVFENSWIIHYLFKKSGIQEPKGFVLGLVQIYLLLVLLIKGIQATPRFLANIKNPAQLVAISFIGLITVGMLVLTLPVSTVDSLGLEPVDALFMSASAVCVTGLAVVDTATKLSVFGQVWIMILIQLGGLGVITFASFLSIFSGQKLNLSHRYVLQEVVSETDVSAVATALKRIIGVTFLIELIGAIIYFFSWADLIPNVEKRAFFSVFHSVSAFCNAGFSLFSNSLADSSNAYSWAININTILLFVIGGLGFFTLWEVGQKWNPLNQKAKQKRLSLHTYITLRMSIILIVFGAVFLLLTEWETVLNGLDFSQKTLVVLFQSATTRTAGFNSVDTGTISQAGTIIMILLMAVGGSPASTAGGIKTTTFYVLASALYATLTGKERVEIRNKTIPNRVVFKAISASFIAVIAISISIILLTITEKANFLDLVFEQVSAFMTVGLSRGITSDLSFWGKINITLSMFLGRIGFLTFALTFSTKAKLQNYRYPEEDVMIA